MKSLSILAAFLLAFVSKGFSQSAYPSFPAFSSIEISSIATVYLRQDSVQSVRMEGDNVRTNEAEVTGGKLIINGSSGTTFYVSIPEIHKLMISGRGEIISQSRITGENLKLVINGDGKMTLDLNIKDLEADLSGLGKVSLSGVADQARFSIPGSGKIDAIALKVRSCTANISGMGKINVDVTDDLNSNISGSGTINYKNTPARVNDNITGIGKVKAVSANTDTYRDTTRIMLGDDRQLWIIGKKDSCKHCHDEARPKWAGFELGLNSYLDRGGKYDLSSDKEAFETNMIKSVAVSINFFQKNFQLGHSNVWFTTGLGFTWNNYRFDSDVTLSKGDSTVATHTNVPGTAILKSKLVVSYLTAPLMFEFLTSRTQSKAFHFGAGAIVGLRLGSHTKQKIQQDGRTFKVKDHDDFNLSPFKYGARVQLGYGDFNLFAEYDASTLFKSGKGPELYPVAVGVTVVGF
ncbi:MAG: DUF2807 domain-containing protein [Bacteroidetes bacterium]|nr:DUF2807 domain-containing protein [Bacteroidota bacterium]